ncbi:MAG: SCP2 sterol-binding domain-containing protein [Pseudomonadota bacterium]
MKESNALHDWICHALETACNKLLAQDPQTATQLAADHGHCIGIAITDLNLTFYVVPGSTGYIQLFTTWEGTPDCLIQGNSYDLLCAQDRTQATRLLFRGKLQIQGEAGLGQRFSRALGGLEIDWEEHLSHWIGDPLAYQVGEATRQLRQNAAERRQVWRENIADYLTEEARLIPHAEELRAQATDIGVLRDDVERLAARICQLETV